MRRMLQECTNRVDQIAVTIIDERTDWILIALAVIGLVAIVFVFAAFLLWNYRATKRRKKFLQNKKRHSSYYGETVRGRDTSVKEQDETVVMLALGLRRMFPMMPDAGKGGIHRKRNSYMAIT
ncbi:hypothetical protein L596_023473 [Steinernema carpocapsae]|uniref:Uncharacterized protein n=1 Tax=Steinernema carpocapsae TaxID=34508 RepID=A0A4U5MDQ6_STECR|nr:hypothetical protein L596_023473 [Steinernema carpocapsae]